MSPSLTQGLSSSSNSFLSYTPLYPVFYCTVGAVIIAAKTAYFLRAITLNTDVLESQMFFAVLRIRIRIHVFLGLQDPDPDPSIIMQK
jgi:hypothetical protein